MPSDKPAPRHGLRRTEPDHPAPGTVIGGVTILPPLGVAGRGLPSGASNPANERSLAPYADAAEGTTTTPGAATANVPAPFKLKR